MDIPHDQRWHALPRQYRLRPPGLDWRSAVDAYRLVVWTTGSSGPRRSVSGGRGPWQTIPRPSSRSRLGGGLAMTAPSRGYQQFEPVYHHYGPHKAGLPPLVPYFRELWHRRSFAAELSKASMRGANTTTFFGQAWLILNPLLLAGVYYLLVTIIRGQHEPSLFA